VAGTNGLMADATSVFAEFGGMLSRVAAMYAPPGADREDLAQEMAMALVRALPRYRGDSSLRTYVYRIAHNCGIRRIARRRAAGAPLDEAEVGATAPGPEREVAARRDVERLALAVGSLPLGARQVLMLALEGLTHAEIGEVLGLAENVVSVRLHRARAALRVLLGEVTDETGARHG
jgi:RNA polymerase sigma factor (sigma-70 family)